MTKASRAATKSQKERPRVSSSSVIVRPKMFRVSPTRKWPMVSMCRRLSFFS